jgi:hypothetical protein
MIEVYIGQKILVQRTEKRWHIRLIPSPVLEQNHGSGNGAIREIVEINCGNIPALALREKALG